MPADILTEPRSTLFTHLYETPFARAHARWLPAAAHAARSAATISSWV